MSRRSTEVPATPAPVYTGPPLAANVSFELTQDELQTLIGACAEGGHFHLGCKLAERKASLRANVKRMEKEAAQFQTEATA